MRIAHIADIHLTDSKGDSGATLDEQVEWLGWIGEDAADAGAALVAVAGDIFDTLSSPAERNAAVRVFRSWAERMPVVCIYGNHDRPGDLDYLGKLRTRHDITVFSRAGQYVTADDDVIACLPWPRKAHLAAMLAAGEDVNAAASQAMRAVLRGFSAHFDTHAGSRIVLAHAELGAALTDSGQPLAGKCDIELSEGDLLESGADYVALGHIHRHQILGDGRICYPGSPRPTRFGEDGVKGYCIVDVERDRDPVIKHRRAPYRELVTVRAEMRDGLLVASASGEPLTDGAGIWSSDDPLPSVRLVYEVGETERQTAAEQADAWRRMWIGSGAHSVKLDARVMAAHRVRSEAIREAHTVADQLRAYWRSRNEQVSREAPILDKLAQLESEVMA